MKKYNIIIAATSLLNIVSGCGDSDISMKNITDGFDFDILPVYYGNRHDAYAGYMNSDGELVIELGNNDPSFNNGLFQNGLAYVCQRNLTGFINKDGELIVDLTGYNSRRSGKYFSEGLYLTNRETGGTITAFNTQGEIEWEAEGYIRTQLRGGYALFSYQKYADECGVINSKGEVVFEPVTKRDNGNRAFVFCGDITSIWFDSPASYAHPSYFPIYNGREVSYFLDVSTGKHILEEMIPSNDLVNIAVDANDRVVLRYDEKYGMIDLDGNWIVAPQYKDLIYDGKWYAFQEDGLWGWMNKDGEVVIPAEFKSSNTPLFGPSDWCLIKDRTFIDRKGNIVLECDYDVETNFIGDRCLVKIRENRDGCVYQWMSRNGELIGEEYRYGKGFSVLDMSLLSRGYGIQYGNYVYN